MSDTEQRVLIVLSNWRRPENTRKIAMAFNEQVHQDHTIAIVDCGVVPCVTSFSRDDWRVPDNGPPTRWLPALLDDDHDYVYFHDDDMLPGPYAISGMIDRANELGDKLGVIGQFGRRFTWADQAWSYKQEWVDCGGDMRPVDCCVRSHLTRPRFVRHALSLRQDLRSRYYGEKVRQITRTHDDLLLHLGVQRATGLSSFMVPADGPYRVAEMELDPSCTGGARPVSANRYHDADRGMLVNMAAAVGWKRTWAHGPLF